MMSLVALPAVDPLHMPHLSRHGSSEHLSDLPSAQRGERALPVSPPSIPPSIPRRSSLRNTSSIPDLSSKSAGKAKAQLPACVSPRDGLSAAMKDPRVLDVFLAMLPWQVFYALTSTCSEFRNILANAELRNIVLSHCLPGFSACLAHASEDRLSAVDLSHMHDLVLFRKWSSLWSLRVLSVISTPARRIVPTHAAASLPHARTIDRQLIAIHSGHATERSTNTTLPCSHTGPYPLRPPFTIARDQRVLIRL